MRRTTSRRWSTIATGVLVLSGCGALVGVQELEVTGSPTDVPEDAAAPVEKDAEPTATDSAPVETDTGTKPLPPPERPPAGTYTYAITGGDQLAGTFGTNSTYGPTATMAIAHEGADCFTMTFHFRNNYDESLHLCRRGTDFVMDKGQRDQVLAGFGVHTEQTCEPGDTYIPQTPAPQQQWNHDCKGNNAESQSGNSEFQTVGPYSFVGQEKLSAFGTEIDVFHFHDNRIVTKAQTGTNVGDWYFAVKNGLLVKLKRAISVDYKAGFGKVTYVENVDMTLNTPP